MSTSALAKTDVQKLLSSAKDSVDPLAGIDATSLGVPDGSWRVCAKRAEDMRPADMQACFNLCKNMLSLYDQVWGWSDAKKKRQLSSVNSRFLLVTTGQSTRPVACANFRFEREDGLPVLYMYELHVSPQHQGRGLGGWLIRILECMAERAGMSKLMLTVFTANHQAVRFYARMGYSLDETSPGHPSATFPPVAAAAAAGAAGQQQQHKAAEESDDAGGAGYYILSKAVRSRRRNGGSAAAHVERAACSMPDPKAVPGRQQEQQQQRNGPACGTAGSSRRGVKRAGGSSSNGRGSNNSGRVRCKRARRL